MREPGVLRRTLIVYAEVAPRPRPGPETVDAAALAEAAALLHAFGEDCHERALEEQFVFRKCGAPVASLRAWSRSFCPSISAGARSPTTSDRLRDAAASAPATQSLFARALEGMTHMYGAHAASQDTMVFPAWKEEQPAERLKEMAERFEELERQQFGNDGFDEAVERMARIEQALSLADLAAYTTPSL